MRSAFPLNIFLFSSMLLAQTAPAPPQQTVHLIVPAGVPLRLALEQRTFLKQPGQPIRARLVEPIYAFDRIVVPSGTEALGRIERLDDVSRSKRARAILAGDFTRLREAQVTFDTLVFRDGKRLPLTTAVSAGTKRVVHLDAGKQKKKGITGSAIDRAREAIAQKKQEAIQMVKAPGKIERAEEIVLAKLPWHPQWLPGDMRFNAELKAPLDFGSEVVQSSALDHLGAQPSADSTVRARLVSPLNSAAVKIGTPVEAVLSEPLFSTDHHLIFPVGSVITGTVTQARPARRLHRNGQLRFTFKGIQPPPGFEHASVPHVEAVEANVSGVDANRSDRLKLDSEGGTQATDSKTRYVTPLAAALLATMSLHQDREMDGDVHSNSTAEAGSGGIGFGLLGTAAGLASRPFAAGLGFYGAGWAFYSGFLARGRDVDFPQDTALEVRFGQRDSSTPPAEPRSELP
jgi:hypothetical protein